MKTRFFKCTECGSIVEVYDSVEQIKWCGKSMEELIPNTSDGAGEKHIPVVTVNNNEVHVKVGEVKHPMVAEHYIQWIYIETENGCQRKMLKPGEEPAATFCLGEEKLVVVYEYCNIHGLWKKEM